MDEIPSPKPRQFRPVNGRIACEPPASTQVEVAVSSGFATAKQKSTLTPLRIVYGNEHKLTVPIRAHTGWLVYIRGEAVMAHAWAKETFEIEPGRRFVLVPEDQILLVEVA